MKDKVIVVTGGAAGIGKATVERFKEDDCRVVFCDLNVDQGRATADMLGVEFSEVDVSDRSSVQQWIDEIEKKYQRVDVLINNAGITRDGLFVKVSNGELIKQMPETDFDLVMKVNLKGCYCCAQAVAPLMIRQGGGVILNASSVVGMDGNFGQTNYVASKSGVIGMTKVWARELGKHGIRVNAVCPGFTATEMVKAMPEKVLENMKNKTPLGRLGTPRDIANAYFFLASDQAAFISGAVLRVDGGIVLGT